MLARCSNRLLATIPRLNGCDRPYVRRVYSTAVKKIAQRRQLAGSRNGGQTLDEGGAVGFVDHPWITDNQYAVITAITNKPPHPLFERNHRLGQLKFGKGLAAL